MSNPTPKRQCVPGTYDCYGVLTLHDECNSYMSTLNMDIVYYCLLPLLRTTPGLATYAPREQAIIVEELDLPCLGPPPDIGPPSSGPLFVNGMLPPPRQAWRFCFLSCGDPVFTSTSEGVILIIRHFGTPFERPSVRYTMPESMRPALGKRTPVPVRAAPTQVGIGLTVDNFRGRLSQSLRLNDLEGTADLVGESAESDWFPSLLPRDEGLVELIATYFNVRCLSNQRPGHKCTHSFTVNGQWRVAFTEMHGLNSSICGVYDATSKRLLVAADLSAVVRRGGFLPQGDRHIWNDSAGNICLLIEDPYLSDGELMPLDRNRRFVWLSHDKLTVMKELFDPHPGILGSSPQVDHRGRICYMVGNRMVCLS